MKYQIRKNKLQSKNRLIAASACLGLLAGSGLNVHAQTTESDQINDLEKQNQILKQRLDSLEDMITKEGLMPGTNSPPSKFVSALSSFNISGFVQASYFYNVDRPANGYSDTYLWNTKNNSFSLNKFKITLASAPVATDKWDVGYRGSLIFGDDAPDLNTGGANGTGVNTTFNDLREAYLEVNVPIGTGLDIKAGEMISLLNWESGDGGAANPNFSEGYQWWYTGNGPSAGIQATYNFTDKIGLTVRVDNGLYQGPVDNNSGKAFSGSLNFKPNDKLWFNIVGWYDVQPAGATTSGIESIGGYQFTKQLGSGYEADYFNFASPGGNIDLWSLGGWLWYNFTDKVGVAFRADYLSQSHGVLGPAVRPGAGLESTDDGGDLGSLTLTLNYTPMDRIKIQPEVRYDYTSYSGGLNGKKHQLIVGCGATYSF